MGKYANVQMCKIELVRLIGQCYAKQCDENNLQIP
jgi:hypothetical protein